MNVLSAITKKEVSNISSLAVMVAPDLHIV